MTYALAGSAIIHEFLTDEVIIANLDAGIYYSLRTTGISIWQLLLKGHSRTKIESLFLEKYGTASSVSSFIDQLLEENLLILTDSEESTDESVFWPETFEPPYLERYDEMKNLLMLDPIHEVDEEGWPNRK